jgi:hypothetical protein
MVEKQIILSTWKNNDEVIFANQGEVNSRTVMVKLSDSNENILKLTDKRVKLYAKKPDGSTIFSDCEVGADGETISTALTLLMLDTAGVVECEFQISDDSGELLKINGLKIMVLKEKEF